jgi:hypothetical protein
MSTGGIDTDALRESADRLQGDLAALPPDRTVRGAIEMQRDMVLWRLAQADASRLTPAEARRMLAAALDAAADASHADAEWYRDRAAEILWAHPDAATAEGSA